MHPIFIQRLRKSGQWALESSQDAVKETKEQEQKNVDKIFNEGKITEEERDLLERFFRWELSDEALKERARQLISKFNIPNMTVRKGPVFKRFKTKLLQKTDQWKTHEREMQKELKKPIQSPDEGNEEEGGGEDENWGLDTESWRGGKRSIRKSKMRQYVNRHDCHRMVKQALSKVFSMQPLILKLRSSQFQPPASKEKAVENLEQTKTLNVSTEVGRLIEKYNLVLKLASRDIKRWQQFAQNSKANVFIEDVSKWSADEWADAVKKMDEIVESLDTVVIG